MAAIQIKAYFGYWQPVDVAEAMAFIGWMTGRITAIKDRDKLPYVLRNHVRVIKEAE